MTDPVNISYGFLRRLRLLSKGLDCELCSFHCCFYRSMLKLPNLCFQVWLWKWLQPGNSRLGQLGYAHITRWGKHKAWKKQKKMMVADGGRWWQMAWRRRNRWEAIGRISEKVEHRGRSELVSESGGQTCSCHLINGNDITADFSFSLLVTNNSSVTGDAEGCYWLEAWMGESKELLLCC